jgi:hypothetical protein
MHKSFHVAYTKLIRKLIYNPTSKGAKGQKNLKTRVRTDIDSILLGAQEHRSLQDGQTLSGAAEFDLYGQILTAICLVPTNSSRHMDKRFPARAAEFDLQGLIVTAVCLVVLHDGQATARDLESQGFLVI